MLNENDASINNAVNVAVTHNEKAKQNKKYSYIDVFRYKSIRNIIFKICPYWTAVLLFDFVVFLNLDNSGKDVYLHAIDIFAACTASAFVAGMLADCLGRKTLMIISAMLSCVAYTLQPYFAMKANDDKVFNVLNMAMLFTACISIETAFTVVVIYSAEVFPTSIRGTAGGVLFTLTRVGAIVSPYVVGKMKYPQIVASGCLIVTMFLICTVSETKGRKLKEEVEEVEKEREDKEREEGNDNGNIDLIPEEYNAYNNQDGNLLVIN
jgi:OCT family organic cation transporter-like MFS transporter 4/5